MRPFNVPVSRNAALRGIGSLGAALTGATATFAATKAFAGPSPACDATPEGEIGPFFADDAANGYNRSRIVSNLDGSATQSGIPLTLKIAVVDGDKHCGFVTGAQVDIWHCNAAGLYSNEAREHTLGQNWLRGYQLTDSSGTVTFRTIVPGWYDGRATHVHLRVRSSYSETASPSDGTNTTQLFLPQSIVDEIGERVHPYGARGANPTTNANDRVYTEQTKGKTQLSLAGSYSTGYSAGVTLVLPIRS